MQGHRNLISFHVPGTLAANLAIIWTAPFDGRIKKVSSVASNNSDALLEVGTTSDADYYFASHTVGDSSVPSVKTRADFASTTVDGSFDEGDVLKLTVDYDGAAGTAANDLTIVLAILEG